MLKKGILILLFTIFSMGIAPNLSSTTLIKSELPELIQDSETIALGTVVGIECNWMVGDGNQKLIYTTYTLEAEEIIKGSSTQSSITFKVVGGAVDDVFLKVPSAPHYDIGDRIIVLLGPEGYERLSDVVGWSHGDFHVVDGMVTERDEPLEDFVAQLTAYIYLEE
jgi:hypothetical protein